MDKPAPETQPVVQPQQSPTPPNPPSDQVKPIKKPTKLPIILMTVIAVLSLTVSAYLGYQNYLLKQQISQSPIASPSPTEDLTADWRTITRKYWSFKVPSGWNFLECSDEDIYVGLEHQEDKTVECNFEPSGTFGIIKGASDYPIAKNLFDSEINEPVVIIDSSKQITVAGENAVRQQEQVSRGGEFYVSTIKVYIKKPDATYVLFLTDLSLQATFDQVLSTFKFLDETEDWKTYTTPKLPKIGFPSVTFNYPPDWIVEEENDGLGTMNFKLSKNGYEITLYQAPMGGSVCLFDDSPEFEGPSSNYRTVEYIETVADIGILRYLIDPNDSQKYFFCQKSDQHFVSFGIGLLELNTPNKIDTKVFREAIEIIKLISIN